MRAVLYTRVSSAGQRDRQTIDSQLKVLPELVKRHGWKLVKPPRTYCDDGRSAKADTLKFRKGLLTLLDDAERGEFDVVVVVDIDRLTRSDQWDERGQILGGLQRAGVRIAEESTGCVHDLNDSGAGDLMIGLRAYGAADWIRKHTERVKRGKDRAIGLGRKPAGPTPFGLSYDRATGQWSIDKSTAKLVREIYERIAGGESCDAIASDFNNRGVPAPTLGARRNSATEWRRERIYTIANSSTYRGEWVADKRRRLAVPVPAIVSDELWYRARDYMARHKQRGLRRTRHVYLVEAIGQCAECAARIGISSNSYKVTDGSYRQNYYYYCGHRRRPPRGGERCELPMLVTAEIDERLWVAVEDLLTNRWDEFRGMVEERRARAARGTEGWEGDLAAAKKAIKRIDKTEGVLLAQFRRGRVSEKALDRELESLRRERLFVSQQVDAAQRATAASKRVAREEDALTHLSALRRAARHAKAEERAAIVRTLVPGRDGHVVLLGTTTIEARVSVAPTAPFSISQVRGSFCRTFHESNVRPKGPFLLLVA